MKLFEYEAKGIVSKYGIPIPHGELADSPEKAREIAVKLGGEVVLKSQVLVGGRGLAGGIKIASSPDEAYDAASKLLGSTIKGEKVKLLLVEEKICFEKEYYLSLTIDRSNRSLVYLASPLGGVEIEDLVRKYPDKLLKISVDPLIGYNHYYARQVAGFLNIPREYWRELDSIMYAMYNVMSEYDAELVEFNPLAWRCGGGLIALDAKILIDDNSLFKHSELKEKYGRELSEYEKKAKELGFSYVELDGDIGVIANGAGLTMATMDLILLHGGRPANFLDVGGGASRDRVKEAVKLVVSHPRVKVLLVNIFGGITRCDEVANGIVEAIRETGLNKPIIIRLLGTNEEEGRRILSSEGYSVFSEIDEAVAKAIELTRR
ncbi:MAG: succinate--CoA ligase subunit beta [Desulfurococcales archaeon ex4484_58]|nr:MAG: succinate--CoA ligase subunit beta [Desulfurococcales archaeon ex4484_58]